MLAHLKVKKKGPLSHNNDNNYYQLFIIIMTLVIVIFPGHSERSASCRNRRCRQNYNSNFLLDQFDAAGTARCGTGDLPHQAGREGAAGRCGRMYFRCCWASVLPLHCWFCFHFVSLLMPGLPLPL